MPAGTCIGTNTLCVCKHQLYTYIQQIGICICINLLYLYTPYICTVYTYSCIVCIHTGGRVVYSEGRLIPHEFPITDLQQISGPDGIGRITCTVSSGIVRLLRDGGEVESEGKLETAITVRGNLHNRAMYCISSDTNNFYLYLTPFISGECKKHIWS